MTNVKILYYVLIINFGDAILNTILFYRGDFVDAMILVIILDVLNLYIIF